tara:strand:- start:68 stop:1234 length:1167 start_codon:yes stop_codon:yes gene_type:complete
MKKKRITVITSSRADYDQLYWLLKKISKNKKYLLKLVVSGSHFLKKYGYSVNQIKKDRFNYEKIYLKINSDQSKDILNTVSDSIKKFSKKLQKFKTDYLVILGDRYEILAAAISASFLKIPIIHLNGGELTFGAHDDWIRHCITKMSNIHFVSNKIYKKRVIQLGENPKYVFNTGGLSSDNALNTKLFSKKKIEKLLNIKFKEKNILITYHPETFSKTGSEKSFLEIIYAIKFFKKVNFFITLPNVDEDNQKIIRLIKKHCSAHKNCKFFLSLGRKKYLSLMQKCNLVLGNSSSGLLEAPYLNVYTINIGNRQEGRIRAKTVIDCRTDHIEIKKLINQIFLKHEKNKINNKRINLKDYYGKGDSAKNMLNVLDNLNFKFDRKKYFYDL